MRRPGEQAQARAAQQHVGDRARLLVAGGDDRLDQQVRHALDDRPAQVLVLGADREHALGEQAVAAREVRARVARRAPARRGSVAGSTGWPSGISCVRQGASRNSRSTMRSTTIFAMRRQVVSLPPVIVISPDEVSYSSALREMSTLFFGSALEISGRTPA